MILRMSKGSTKNINFEVCGIDNIRMKHGSLFGAVIGCSIFLFISELILIEVSKYQTEPYMDEVFHIAQAQKFCAGRYSEVKYTG